MPWKSPDPAKTMKIKDPTKAIMPALLVALLAPTACATDVAIEAGGEKFVVSESDGRVFRIAGGKRQRVFSRTLRVKTPAVSGQVVTAGGLSKLSVKEIFPAFTIVRGEFALAAKEPGKGEPAPFDEAKLQVEYLFRKDLPGFVATETLLAEKPFFFGGWSIVMSPAFARFAKDDEGIRGYPTRAELKSVVGGYRTNASKYIVAEEPDGTRWWMGREFGAFEPRGDAKPGRSRWKKAGRFPSRSQSAS